jgi:hypothetical protein
MYLLVFVCSTLCHVLYFVFLALPCPVLSFYAVKNAMLCYVYAIMCCALLANNEFMSPCQTTAHQHKNQGTGMQTRTVLLSDRFHESTTKRESRFF